MSQVQKEIEEQPGALGRLLREGREPAEEVAARVRAFGPRFVVIAARGSSDNAARYAQYLFGAHNRLPVCLATPSLFTFYDAAPSLAGALVIGVSQSGQSPDIVAVVESGRRQGALTLALTNRPASPLGQAAELCLAPRRRGARGGRHQDLHRRADRAGHAERRRRRRHGAWPGARPGARARGAAIARRGRETSRSRATATSRTSSSSAAASTTRPPSRWRSS